MPIDSNLETAIANAIEQASLNNKAQDGAVYLLAILQQMVDANDHIPPSQQSIVDVIEAVNANIRTSNQHLANIYSRQNTVQSAITTAITTQTTAIVDKLQELIDKP